jgi:hypothetical protein
MPQVRRGLSVIVGVATPILLGVATMSNAQSRVALPDSANPSPTTEADINAGHAPTAQTAATHWTVELRGGLGLATNPSAGAGQLPALGAIISPASSTQGPVRAVSSWFFGDGAAQLNSIAASASPPGLRLPPLDAVLTTRSANRGSGGAFGVTISRNLSARLSADFSFDVNVQPLALTSAATSAIERARAGFAATWQPSLAAVSPAGAPPVVTAATTEQVVSAGGQIEGSGTLTYHPIPGSRFNPFITFGAGILVNVRSTPNSVLTGNYDASVVDPRSAGLPFAHVNQTDVVRIDAQDGRARLVGILGGGVEKALSPSSGLRFAARLAVGSNHAETTLTASPTTRFGAPPLDQVLISNAATTIILPTTLTGPSLTGFKTFIGQGLRVEATITVGYFFRF